MRCKRTLLFTWMILGCNSQSGKVPVAEVEPTTETVVYPSGKGSVRGIRFRPAGEGPFPALVVIHDDRGLTDWTKEQAKRLAGRGFVVLAVDLYRGEVVSNLLDAHIMDRGLPEDRVYRDLKAAVDYLTSDKNVRAEALGVVGWDMGGGYALDAAMRDQRLRAVVTCYGRLTTDPKLLAPMKASVFGIFAGKDEGIPPETIEQFRVAMNKAGKRTAGLTVYPNCGHGFLDPASPSWSGPPPAPEDIADAWRKIETYLDGELKR